MTNSGIKTGENELIVFSGTSNPELAEEICRILGRPLGQALIRTFSDGEIFVEIKENVRGRDVFVIQPTSTPVNANLIELLIMIDALKRASANSITAVMPYYGYARQDSKVAPRVPISAKLVADLIAVAGANRVLTMDLHRGQIQGFFDIPVDHLYAAPVQMEYVRASFPKDIVIVSPDVGGVERARRFAEGLDTDLAIVDRREDTPPDSETFAIIGDVRSRVVLIMDDIVDTGTTIIQAAEALKAYGASHIYSCVTHPVLSGESLKRIEASPIERLVVTNTIRLSEQAKKADWIECLSVANLLSEAILRIHYNDSVSSLFV